MVLVAPPTLRRIERQVEARIRAGVADEPSGVVTVASYAKTWLKEREALHNYATEEARVRLYLLPAIGKLPISDVRPRHLVALVKDLKAAGTLAIRSVHHVYWTAHGLFRDAIVDELITTNPCVLTKKQLGKKTDKNPEWRANAIFTRDEVEALISSTLVPTDRKMIYAVAALAGLRFGEIAGLRWRHYDPKAQPLGRLLIAHSHAREGTKTDVTRLVPVHPVLAAILAEWKLGGWVSMMGRHPLADDLVIPSRKQAMRKMHHNLHKLHEDLARLGFRKRRFHDLRRTFITLARVDGARADLLEMVSHAPRGDILNIYSTMPWPSLCAEVAKLQVERREGQVSALPGMPQVAEKTKTVTTDSAFGVTVSGNPTAATEMQVEAAGIEPASESALPLASTCVFGDLF